jgi:hypothetical protein
VFPKPPVLKNSFPLESQHLQEKRNQPMTQACISASDTEFFSCLRLKDTGNSLLYDVVYYRYVIPFSVEHVLPPLYVTKPICQLRG